MAAAQPNVTYTDQGVSTVMPTDASPGVMPTALLASKVPTIATILVVRESPALHKAIAAELPREDDELTETALASLVAASKSKEGA